jgi:hypothetical protein
MVLALIEIARKMHSDDTGHDFLETFISSHNFFKGLVALLYTAQARFSVPVRLPHWKRSRSALVMLMASRPSLGESTAKFNAMVRRQTKEETP